MKKVILVNTKKLESKENTKIPVELPSAEGGTRKVDVDTGPMADFVVHQIIQEK